MTRDIRPSEFARALRLPFLTASLLPFILGSLIEKSHFQLVSFLFGFICVAAMHLGANLLNDYADSKSGADWGDRRFFGFFGGSKLIQENILSEQFYLKSAIICFLLSLGSVLFLAFWLKSLFIIAMYLLIFFLGFAYSLAPFRFSYRRFGEVIIFLLFGPALVMGGYYIQTSAFPTLQGFLLSLPFSFFTTAVLFANEIPDFPEDIKTQKLTLVSLTKPQRAYILYAFLMFAGFLAVVLNIQRGYLSPFSMFSLLLIIPALKAGAIIKNDYSDKLKLVKSSRITIGVQTWVSVILIVGILL